jgi:Flp pilus assembly pilin Flp
MSECLRKIHQDESGQDIIEYVLIAALITVVAIAILPAIGTKVVNYWSNLNTVLT